MGGLRIQDALLTHLPAFIAAAVVGSSSYLHLIREIQVATLQSSNGTISIDDKAVAYRPAPEGIIRALFENGTEELFISFTAQYKLQEVMQLKDLTSQSRLQTFLASHMYSSINSAYRKTIARQDIDRLNSCSFEWAI